MKCCVTICCQKLTANSDDYFWNVFECCITLDFHTHIHAGIWTVESFQHLHFEVSEYPPYNPHLSPSVTCLVHSQVLQEALSLPVNNKWRNLHAWLATHQKTFFIRACRNLFTAGLSMVIAWVCMENDALTYFALILKKYISDTFWLTHIQGLVRK